MLHVLENFAKLRSYTFLSMHGGTPISSRQPMVKTFNEVPWSPSCTAHKMHI